MTPEEVENTLITRINLKFPLSLEEVLQRQTGETFRDFNAIRYFDVSDDTIFRKMLPISVAFLPSRVAICVQKMDDPDLIPHRDFMIPCSITVYLQTDGDSKLVFWKDPLNDTKTTNKAPAVYNSNEYPDLEAIYTDIPKVGEAVLLNNASIHSVVRKRTEDRIMLQYQFPFPYRVIRNKLKYGV